MAEASFIYVSKAMSNFDAPKFRLITSTTTSSLEITVSDPPLADNGRGIQFSPSRSNLEV
jgi:hypothetical protein